MHAEHRYRDEEVREILRIAAHSDEMPPPSIAGEGGLTLRAVQEIGKEAGIDPQNIAAAAHHLEMRAQSLPPERFLGLPVSVARVIDLPRPLTSHEWEIVVGYLRDTFTAPGEVGVQGGTREWSNGSLRVLLEPAEHGHRLRFSTLNRRFRSLAGIGAGLLATGLVFLAVLVPEAVSTHGLSVPELFKLIPPFIVAGGGITYVAWARLSLRRWALERESQMERIGLQVRALIAKPPVVESEP